MLQYTKFLALSILFNPFNFLFFPAILFSEEIKSEATTEIATESASDVSTNILGLPLRTIYIAVGTVVVVAIAVGIFFWFKLKQKKNAKKKPQ